MTTSSNIQKWLVLGAAPAFLAIAAFSLGAFLFGAASTENESFADASDKSKHEDTTWTCSMHPAVQMEEQGKCPICLMDLIPLTKSAGSGAQVSLQPGVIDLLSIETRPVVRQAIGHAISMVGTLAIDETRTSMISAWVPGRIDRLFVDSTGIFVRKGDHLADLYSPPLYQAQVELSQAHSALERAEAGRNGAVDESLVAAATSGVHAVEERMRLWGLSKTQIADFASLDEPTDRITIFAPSSGVVTSKLVHEGHYIDTGTPIYQIADLSSLWLELQAFESDLPWLILGQKVEFTTDSLSGEKFEGLITFIEPWIDSSTRTAKLRVEVPNPGGRLKPEMFVRADVIAQVGAGGAALAPDLEGAYSCPMHPEVRSEEEGSCPICEMPLEPLADLAESFGLAATSQESGLPLIIPTTAPLITGKRAVVYVQTEGEDGARLFEGREIELGPRASGMYVVLGGLEEGELVVTRGVFKLDSELELKAQPSWMNSGVWDVDQPTSRPASVEQFEALPPAFTKSWNGLWLAYLEIQESLAGDDPEALLAALAVADERMGASFGEGELAEDAGRAWSKDRIALTGSLQELMVDGLDMAQQRARFEIFTGAVNRAMEHYGSAVTGPVYVVHCPMAFDGRGADWLQADQLVNNPYYGAAMLRCGSVESTLVEERTEEEHVDENDVPPTLEGPEKPLLPEPDSRPVEKETAQLSEPATQESLGVEDAPKEEPLIEVAQTTFDEHWNAFWHSYLAIQESLAADDPIVLATKVTAAAEILIASFDEGKLDEEARGFWAEDKAALGEALRKMSRPGLDLAASRVPFEALSKAAASAMSRFGGSVTGPVYRVHCPMAFGGRGADWLQADRRVNNPYYGAMMLRCGSVSETLVSETEGDK